MKKWLIVLLAVVIVAAAGIFYWYNYRDKETQSLAAVQPTARVTQGNISVQLTGNGSVSTTEKVSVTAGAQGKVSKVNFKQGDVVKKGQVLVEFEQEDYTSQIKRAEIDIQKQELQLSNYKKQFIEASDDENKQNEIKLQIDSLKLDMESAALELDDLRSQAAETPSIVAPAGGTVTTANVAVGDQVNESKVVAEIIDYTRLQFHMNVDELDIPKVKVGMATNITLNALPTERLTGKVLEIAKEGSSSNGSASYEVVVSLDKIDNVISGMSGEGSIVTASSENTLLAPIAAVRTIGGRSFVQVPESSATGQSGQGTTGQGAGNGGNGAAAGSGGAGSAAGGNGTQAGNGASAGNGGAGGNGAAGSGTTGGAAQQGGRGGNFNQAYGGGYGQTRNGQGGSQRGAGATGAATTGRMVEVTIGLSNETYVEIKSGLNAGDTVLLPIPAVNTATASSSRQQQQQFQFGQYGGGGFAGGGFAGGTGGFGGAARTGGGGGNR